MAAVERDAGRGSHRPGCQVGPLIEQAAREAALAAVGRARPRPAAGCCAGGESDRRRRLVHAADAGRGRRPGRRAGPGGGVRARLRAASGAPTPARPREIANGVRHGLSTAIFTRDLDRALELTRDLDTGLVRSTSRPSGVDSARAVRRREGVGDRPPRAGPGRPRLLHQHAHRAHLAQQADWSRGLEVARTSAGPKVAADVAAFAFLDGAMQVLLVRRRYEPYESYWALPGGGLHPDETLEQAAERELLEETGGHGRVHGAAGHLLRARPRPAGPGRSPAATWRWSTPAGSRCGRARIAGRPPGGRWSRCWRRSSGGPVLAFDHDTHPRLRPPAAGLQARVPERGLEPAARPVHDVASCGGSTRPASAARSSPTTSAASRWAGACWPRTASGRPAAGRPRSTGSPSGSR